MHTYMLLGRESAVNGNCDVGGHRGLCGEVANEGLHIDPSTRTHSAALQSELIHTIGSPQTLSERSRDSGTAVDYTRRRDGVEDIRSLPVPIPRWKRSQCSRAKPHWTYRVRRLWEWRLWEWKLWQCDCLRNGWRMKAVRAECESCKLSSGRLKSRGDMGKVWSHLWFVPLHHGQMVCGPN